MNAFCISVPFGVLDASAMHTLPTGVYTSIYHYMHAMHTMYLLYRQYHFPSTYSQSVYSGYGLCKLRLNASIRWHSIPPVCWLPERVLYHIYGVCMLSTTNTVIPPSLYTTHSACIRCLLTHIQDVRLHLRCDECMLHAYTTYGCIRYVYATHACYAYMHPLYQLHPSLLPTHRVC